jgi:hypothetical protein
MRHCSICRVGKQLHEFESVRGNCWRNECRECRRVQRRQRTRVTSTDASEDTASIVSGGVVTLASDADYDGSIRDQEERMRDSLRPLEEQLRALTDEHRKGSMPSIGQRLVQLEHEMQSLRGGNWCQCTARDPLWEVIVWLVCTTVVFVLLRWVEGRLWAKRRETGTDERESRK